jgi:hypothetical protein
VVKPNINGQKAGRLDSGVWRVKGLRRLSIALLVALSLAVLLLVALPLYEGWSTRKIISRAPELAAVYNAEQQRFPDYSVGVFKNYQYVQGEQKTTYSVTLTSQKPASDDQASAAGKLACKSGLQPSSVVRVVVRQQYLFLPIYSYRGRTGYCPQAL